MRIPRILTHAFDAESKSVSFGWALFIVATLLFFYRYLDVAAWERIVYVAAFLVGGKLLKEGYLDGKKADAALPAPPPSQK